MKDPIRRLVLSILEIRKLIRQGAAARACRVGPQNTVLISFLNIPSLEEWTTYHLGLWSEIFFYLVSLTTAPSPLRVHRSYSVAL